MYNKLWNSFSESWNNNNNNIISVYHFNKDWIEAGIPWRQNQDNDIWRQKPMQNYGNIFEDLFDVICSSPILPEQLGIVRDKIFLLNWRLALLLLVATASRRAKRDTLNHPIVVLKPNGRELKALKCHWKRNCGDIQRKWTLNWMKIFILFIYLFTAYKMS